MVGCFRDAERDHQVIECKDGAAARGTDDAAERIDLPTLGGAGQHDVLLVGINEHVSDALQTGHIANCIGQRFASCAGGRDFRFQLFQ
jgi:hypothetical protein